MSTIKLWSLLATLCITLGLAGCGSSSSPYAPGQTPPDTEEPDDTNGDSDDDDTDDNGDDQADNGDDATDDDDTASEFTLDHGLDFERLHELAEFPVGIAVSAGNEGRSIFRSGERAENERAVIEHHFNQLTAGNIMKMSYLHNNWGNYTYDEADQLVDYAHDEGMTVHGHALVWHSCYQVPQWVRDFEGDAEAFLADLTTHVQTIAAEYSGKVASWDVVNEAFHDSGEYREGIDNCWDDGGASAFYGRADGPAYIETAFAAAREADPAADLYYNDFNLVPNDEKLEAVLAMVDDFQERDVPIDGIGFQMHIHIGWPSIENISASFQSVVDRGLKVKITELDIPYYNPWSHDEPPYEFDEEVQQMQKERYCQVVEAYLNVVPEDKRGGLTVWGLVDGDSWLNDHFFDDEESYPLLFNDDLTPKPALQGVADALRGRDCT